MVYYMNKIFKFVFFITLMSFATVSCNTPRSVIKQPIKEEGSDYLFRKLKENELSFESLSSKFNLDLIIDKKKTSFNGQIRIKKDSLIWVSFSPALGIEVARLMISEDTVKFINRINNTYFIGDYNFVNEFLQTSIDFDILQSFIIGNDLQYYEMGSFKASIDGHEYKLLATGRNKVKRYIKSHETVNILIQNIWLSPESFKITGIDLKEIKNQNKKLDVRFADFKPIEGQLIPHFLHYEISSSNAYVYVDVNLSKIDIDKKLSFPFTIPQRFTPMN